MNFYKKIIPSRKLRVKILKLLGFIPDKTMLKIQYMIKMGRMLNLKTPERFTEKIQWYKLNYKNPIMPQCVDKYDVREYVKSLGLESILNECYGVYNSADEIDFDILPDKFVIKDTLGGGGNSVIICKDKSKLNIDKTKEKLNKWAGEKIQKRGGREWPYYSGKRNRIIIEKYIEADENDGGLVDYKFFCFQGKVHYLYVMKGRNSSNGLAAAIYTRDFMPTGAYIAYDKELKEKVIKPEHYEQMVTIAEKLSAEFPHARIDLYNEKGQIIFGEITFYGASGYTIFTPDEFDLEMGEKFILPNN